MEYVKKSFKKYLKNKNIYFPFGNREERAEFISKIYENFLKNSVLDVGCNEGSLKNYIPKGVKYVGIDISGKLDIIIDL